MHATFEDGPNFEWQAKPFDQQHEAHDPQITADTVVTTVKNIINTFLNKPEVPAPATTIPDDVVGVQETTSSVITEILQTNSTALVPDVTILEETTNSSVITEVLQSNNTVLLTNNTVLTGVTDTINTVVTATEDAITSTSSIFTDMNTSVDVTETNTESMVSTVSDVVTSMMSSTTEAEELYTNSGHTDEIEDNTLIIVLGVMLAVFISIMIILLIIYKRYRSRNCTRAGVYCVNDLNEISIARATPKDTSTECKQ